MIKRLYRRRVDLPSVWASSKELVRWAPMWSPVVTRPARLDDVGFLEAMLFEAFFWDDAVVRPVFSAFRLNPDFVKLLGGWGRPGDRGVVAESGETRVGAAWFRLWTPDVSSYGFVDAATPELAIAVARTHRGRGIGRTLMRDLLAIARADGYAALSLSVNPNNPARALYESLGFQKVGEGGTSWTLRVSLGVEAI